MGNHICPECSKGRIVYDNYNGEYYCSECGIVLNEYAFLQRGTDPSYQEVQTHTPIGNIEEMGPSTEITPGRRDGQGNYLHPGQLLEIHRLRKTEQFTKFPTSTARNLNHMLGFMNAIMSRLEITRPAREFAFRLYSDLVHRRLTVGRDARALAAASMYASCRYYKQPYTIEDIAMSVFDFMNPAKAKKRVGKAYRKIIKNIGFQVSPQTPADYIARYSSELGLSDKVALKARELLARASKSGTPGGEPASVAAALIYLASRMVGKKVTQKKITDITGVTDTTIRTRYRELKTMFVDT